MIRYQPPNPRLLPTQPRARPGGRAARRWAGGRRAEAVGRCDMGTTGGREDGSLKMRACASWVGMLKVLALFRAMLSTVTRAFRIVVQAGSDLGTVPPLQGCD
jgi:hypothetical protein